MAKKLFTALLIVCFSTLIITSAYAGTSEEETEQDRRQGRAVLAAIGIVAIVGAIYMVSKMDFADPSYSSFFENRDGKGFKISIDNLNYHFSQQEFAEEDESLTPTLNLIYAW